VTVHAGVEAKSHAGPSVTLSFVLGAVVAGMARDVEARRAAGGVRTGPSGTVDSGGHQSRNVHDFMMNGPSFDAPAEA